MKKYLFLAIFIPLIFLGIQNVKASGNLSGYAWSENIGWISFNCNNQDICATSDYGVDVNIDNGKLSGYAWSDNIGWISFNESNTGVPPSNDPCDETCIAKATPSGQLGKSDVGINGWTRALNQGNGWDGWIRFDNGKSNEAYIDEEGDFHGYAWSDVVIGWISFNCDNQGVCATSDYKVYFPDGLAKTPTAEDLNDPDDSETYCNIAPETGLLSFEWTYYDADPDNQESFDFRVNDVNNENDPNPEIDRSVEGLSNPSGTVNTQSLSTKEDLDYGKVYYWWVRVSDSTGRKSDWTQGPNFDTPLHAYPWPDFSYAPAEPSVDETVNFTDETLTYGGATANSWAWQFEDGNPETSSEQNASTSFNSNGNKNVSLATIDTSGYSCTDSKDISVQIALPDWKEVPPTSYIFKALASLTGKLYLLKAKLFFW